MKSRLRRWWAGRIVKPNGHTIDFTKHRGWGSNFDSFKQTGPNDARMAVWHPTAPTFGTAIIWESMAGQIVTGLVTRIEGTNVWDMYWVDVHVTGRTAK